MVVVIIGAGLSGSLLALRMAQRGYEVRVFERRPDMRKTSISAGRSINLALSNRGINALKMVGLEEDLLKIAVPMQGRMIHPLGGDSFFSTYSGRKDEFINSISRGELNKILLDKAELFPNLSIQFDCNCQHVDLQTATARFEDLNDKSIFEVKGAIILGTDGANSALRQSMMSDRNILFNYSQDFLSHGYKELNIPPETSGVLEKNALHIWPRGEFMIIALPNPQGDFTATIFMSHKGKIAFEQISNEEDVVAFFMQFFPDILPLIPDIAKQYFENPVGSLITIKCSPWQANGKTLMLGDAAHAIVPFYGQGMNCAFEDVFVFDQMLDKHGADFNALFEEFQDLRIPNANAIADLAIDNFYEMRDHTANPIFQKKRMVETRLEQQFEDYFSKYSLVTFRADIPYEEAMNRGRKQDALLMEICERTEDINSLDLLELRDKLYFK
ncbi:MAG: FAD-dependent oxidoreductase [Saprospiraceae bacterium]